MAVLAVDLAAREGGEHLARAAVADVALLAVQDPGAVGLLDRARSRCCRRPSPRRLGEREARRACGRSRGRGGSAPSARRCRTCAMPLKPIDWCTPMTTESVASIWAKVSNTRAVAGLGEALAAVLLGDVEPAQAGVAELAHQCGRRSSASPRARAGRCARRSRALRCSGRGTRSCSASSGCGHGNTSSSWISPQEEGLGERRRRLLGALLLGARRRRRLHQSSKLLPRAGSRYFDLSLRDNSAWSQGAARRRTSRAARRRPPPAAVRRRRLAALALVAAIALIVGLLVGKGGGGKSLALKRSSASSRRPSPSTSPSRSAATSSSTRRSGSERWRSAGGATTTSRRSSRS